MAVPILLANLISCKQTAALEPLEADALTRLYQEALVTDQEITVWGGGDAPYQLDWIKEAWEKDFPEIKINIRVDLSKFLDEEIDQQLASGNLTPDVVHLQTVNDFHRWRDEGVLEPYKSIHWDQINADYKDVNGYFTPLYMISFSHIVNTNATDILPDNYTDFLKPEFKDQLILTYPHDDDAVLFVFKKIIDKYGWEYLDQLIAQNPQWIRGTEAPGVVVGRAEKAGTFGIAGYFDQTLYTNGSRFILPTVDPFLTWAQTGAIFKLSKHKAAAKLYISWLTSKKIQEQWIQWSVRRDVPLKNGYQHFSTYPNTSPKEFETFMLDREALTIFREQVAEKIGPVQGGSPLTDPEILRIIGL
ncbi:ABC transporter substrate-binding protein [Sphingobacteriaceae bacterium WQ 2009]|uniref:ABC transporter substrate-binding protein n=1 Tax=Rhinopithecimicrobium faecis TaxID=2820698 RepID=A0A8T4H8B7_9SPHI|nr:ABC transporter substrate-binding protein [Sphingobacteriaceae bacterium WQ 2009]